jgi:cytochrome P450
MLGVLLAAQEDPQAQEEVKDLDDDMIVDNILVYWFAAYDTTSTTLTWILKLLIDNPEVFRRVQVKLASEHRKEYLLLYILKFSA